MRGTASRENAVAPALASAAIESSALLDERNEIVTAPLLNELACWVVNGWTESTTSAPESSLL